MRKYLPHICILQILTQKLLDCEDANIRQMHQFL